MCNAEKRTIINVLSVYLSSSILVIVLLSYFFYNYLKDEQNQITKTQMTQNAKEIYNNLETMHKQLINPSFYPKYHNFNSAIYDIDKNLIYSNTANKNISFSKNFYSKNGKDYLIYESNPYYMGAAFIVIEQDQKEFLTNLSQNIIYLALFVIAIIIGTSFYLVKQILKPLKQSVELLDTFIKDTTHELNTPVSTILTNIEILEETNENKNIKRIKTAAFTISNLYNDLVYLSLNKKESSNNEQINLNKLIQQRIEYFDALSKNKNIKINIEEKGQLKFYIDRKKISKVIDNLLSNSIKYSKPNNQIIITINTNSFSIKDFGDGMTKEQIQDISKRFTRFNTSQGGFGIGFNIVQKVADEYNIKIDIQSKIKEGTCITLNF